MMPTMSHTLRDVVVGTGTGVDVGAGVAVGSGVSAGVVMGVGVDAGVGVSIGVASDSEAMTAKSVKWLMLAETV